MSSGCGSLAGGSGLLVSHKFGACHTAGCRHALIFAAMAVGTEHVPFVTRLLQYCILTMFCVCFLAYLLVQMIDCSKFDWLDFDMKPEKRQELLMTGMRAAAEFLQK
jgi:hypothetical protein